MMPSATSNHESLESVQARLVDGFHFVQRGDEVVFFPWSLALVSGSLYGFAVPSESIQAFLSSAIRVFSWIRHGFFVIAVPLAYWLGSLEILFAGVVIPSAAYSLFMLPRICGLRRIPAVECVRMSVAKRGTEWLMLNVAFGVLGLFFLITLHTVPFRLVYAALAAFSIFNGAVACYAIGVSSALAAQSPDTNEDRVTESE